jgi:hypothetical protein
MTQLTLGLRWGLGLLVAAGLLGMPSGAQSQDGRDQPASAVDDSPAPRVAGTAVEFVLALNPFAAEGADAANAALLEDTGTQRSCAATCSLRLPINLPSGVSIVGIELDAFDGTTGGQVIANLLRCPRGATNCVLLTSAGTIFTEAPGPIQVRNDLTVPRTVDNGAETYVASINISTGSPNLRFGGLRVFFRLQVSPTPAGASFADVPPTHPFFRFIEALARSGITSGCGGGNFCPDAPITRGQMAAFLAIALGLHFAP